MLREQACILIASRKKPGCGQLEGCSTQERSKFAACKVSPLQLAGTLEVLLFSFCLNEPQMGEFIFHHQRGKSLLNLFVGQRNPN